MTVKVIGDQDMSTTTTRICTWGGFAAMAFWIVGFFAISGFVPPPAPTDTAEQVAARYIEHGFEIRLGLMITAFGGALVGLWTAAVAVFLKRIEGRFSPLTFVQLTMGGLICLEFITPMMTFFVAAYRPERAPEITQVIDDLAWLPFIGATYTIIVQAFAVALAILTDKRERPILPRWVGYVTVLDLIGMCPAALLIFFKTGPLAWNGIFAFWLVSISYTTWIVALSVAMLKNLHRLPESEAEVSDGSGALVSG